MAEEEQLAQMKAQVYRDPRPSEYFDGFHERTRTREPDWVYELVRVVVSLYAWIVFRTRGIATDRVPAAGPVILAPNHFSFMDHFFVAALVRRRVRFMGKSQLFTPPLQWIYTHGGVFPVRRGHNDEEAFTTAESVLERGGPVVMYCEGGRSRTGRISDTARRGIGRLVLESGAPVVPVAIYGSQRVRNWKRLQFPKVTVQFGELMTFPVEEHPSRERQHEISEEVFARVRAMYTGLEKQGRRGVIRALRKGLPTPESGETSPES